MSKEPGVDVFAWLKAVGLAVGVAFAIGIIVRAIAFRVWWADPHVEAYATLAPWCAGTLSFFIALVRGSKAMRAWWAGLSRGRRVSAWLFVACLLLFAASQLWVEVMLGGMRVRLAEGAVDAMVWEAHFSVLDAAVQGFREFKIRWMPVTSWRAFVGHLEICLVIPLWLIAVLSLWPWWKPPLVWLLGGRVRGGRPRRSWHVRVALFALVTCGILAWLSYQDLGVLYGGSCSVALTRGRAVWHHDPDKADWGLPWACEMNGYRKAWRPWKPQATTGPNGWNVHVPMWPAPVICLAWLILAVRPRHRFRRRWENGLCLQCGYDLRGLKERCTECGQAIEPERLAQLAGVGDLPESGAGGGRRAADP